jgi:hypothetical protein
MDTTTHNEFAMSKEGADLIKAIKKLHFLCYNWNGFKALKPKRSIQTACKLLGQMYNLEKRYPDSVYPDGSGNIVFQWDEDHAILLTIEPDKLHLSSENKDGSVVFVSNIIYNPDEIDIPLEIKTHLINNAQGGL